MADKTKDYPGKSDSIFVIDINFGDRTFKLAIQKLAHLNQAL